MIPVIKLQASVTTETIYYVSSIRGNALKLSNFHFFTPLPQLRFITLIRKKDTPRIVKTL